jgi:hypothetical protein
MASKQSLPIKESPVIETISPTMELDKAERAGGRRLNATQRDRVTGALRHYLTMENVARHRFGSKEDRQHFKRVAKRIENLLHELTNWRDEPKTKDWFFWDLDLDQDEFVRSLQKMKEVAQRRSRGWGLEDAGRYRRFPALLLALDEIFVEAGGDTKIIRREEEERIRTSKFIDFVWSLIEPLPKELRPSSHWALASAWEEIRPLRANRVWDRHYRNMRAQKK